MKTQSISKKTKNAKKFIEYLAKKHDDKLQQHNDVKSIDRKHSGNSDAASTDK
jgi:hypothetical protein